eukprot:TRINITY_DN12840_c0_g1_i1.p1 TRINITY_DN12840_c0_g1~~TRINITY_DN12840_c0_g1_i1.p1  ORF type:complete len:432 (+),score=107.89 TRINITY_DN12840_c0_g1_i1:137-1297(+)
MAAHYFRLAANNLPDKESRKVLQLLADNHDKKHDELMRHIAILEKKSKTNTEEPEPELEPPDLYFDDEFDEEKPSLEPSARSDESWWFAKMNNFWVSLEKILDVLPKNKGSSDASLLSTNTQTDEEEDVISLQNESFLIIPDSQTKPQFLASISPPSSIHNSPVNGSLSEKVPQSAPIERRSSDVLQLKTPEDLSRKLEQLQEMVTHLKTENSQLRKHCQEGYKLKTENECLKSSIFHLRSEFNRAARTRQRAVEEGTQSTLHPSRAGSLRSSWDKRGSPQRSSSPSTPSSSTSKKLAQLLKENENLKKEREAQDKKIEELSVYKEKWLRLTEAAQKKKERRENQLSTPQPQSQSLLGSISVLRSSASSESLLGSHLSDSLLPFEM